MWQFFSDYPEVFVISLVLLLLTVIYVLHLLLHKCKWFRLGLTGLEVSRDDDPDTRPPRALERLMRFLRRRNPGDDEGERSKSDE